ncbi:hypothetical protein D3C81_1809250 [compost metagenome]
MLDHFLDIGAGGERFGRTGQQHAADAWIAFEGVQRLVQLVDQLRVERIKRLRAIQGQAPDSAVDFYQQGVVSHLDSSTKHYGDVPSSARNALIAALRGRAL